MMPERREDQRRRLLGPRHVAMLQHPAAAGPSGAKSAAGMA